MRYWVEPGEERCSNLDFRRLCVWCLYPQIERISPGFPECIGSPLGLLKRLSEPDIQPNRGQTGRASY